MKITQAVHAQHKCLAQPRLWLRQGVSEGARVWGVVAEVGTRELVISLPHGLRGHVAAAEARLNQLVFDHELVLYQVYTAGTSIVLFGYKTLCIHALAKYARTCS